MRSFTEAILFLYKTAVDMLSSLTIIMSLFIQHNLFPEVIFIYFCEDALRVEQVSSGVDMLLRETFESLLR